jgi:hypothetical protein
MEDKNELLGELATIKLPERELQKTNEIVYWDRRIWNYRNPDTGEASDTVDKIRELLDDSEITKDQIIVTQPVFTELPVFDEFKQYILEGLGEGKIPRAIVIPQRTKAETYDGHTIRVNVSSEDFIELGKKLDVPIYQIDVGRIYPPSKKEVQRKREEEAKKEYEPRYQKNIDIVIKTESGKVICIDSSSMLNIFFPRGTFTEDERLAALRKTFPEGQPFYEPPDYFNKHYASKLKEGRFRGLRLNAGASKWKGETIQSLWFGILDGKKLTSTQTAGNPSFQSVREDGATESHIFSQGDYDTVLFMEEMGKAEPSVTLSVILLKNLSIASLNFSRKQKKDCLNFWYTFWAMKRFRQFVFQELSRCLYLMNTRKTPKLFVRVENRSVSNLFPHQSIIGIGVGTPVAEQVVFTSKHP